MSGLILVTGGSGKTGRRIMETLENTGVPYREAARRGAGPKAAHFDWLDRSTWEAALDGTSAVYLLSPTMSEDPAPLLIDFVKKAMSMDIRRFVLQSASLLPAGGPAMGKVHQWLADNAPEWAVLRPSWFMQNFSEGAHIRTIRAEGKIYSAAGDGPLPFIHVGDIARCAVAMLTSEQPANRDFVLTGADLLTYDDVAQKISDAAGRSVVHVRLTLEQLAAAHQKAGLNPIAAHALAAMDDAISKFAENRVTPCVKDLTGQDPVRFQTFVNEAVSSWRL